MMSSRAGMSVVMLGGALVLGGCGLVLDWSGYDDGAGGAGASASSGLGGQGHGGQGGDGNQGGGAPVCEEACPADEVCERLESGGTACFPPLHLLVKVRRYDQISAAGASIPRARVVIVDEVTGRALTRAVEEPIVLGDEKDIYRVAVPATRRSDGAPVSQRVYPAVQAAGCTNYPTWVSPPVIGDLGKLPDEGLLSIKLACEGPNSGVSLAGSMKQGSVPGALVVANPLSADPSTVRARAMSVVDADGAFVLYNLPPGAMELTAHAAGVTFESVPLNVPNSGNLPSQDLKVLNSTTFKVSGIVAALGGTTIVAPTLALVPQSAANLQAGTGHVPPGMRTSIPSSDTFTFSDVPRGHYRLIGALELGDGAVIWRRLQDVIVVGDADVDVGTVPLLKEISVVSPAAGQDVLLDAPISFDVDEVGLVSAELVVFGPGGSLLDTVQLTFQAQGRSTWTPSSGQLKKYDHYSYLIQVVGPGAQILRQSELYRGFFRVTPP
ncbi:carboxypeptidase-like regulatory domain-containing protein [Chondromyces crocatus]|uniref:Uncharacterized protein n=1 Tax=Chondromyces crocatus TaxID=52 RepID=A0A0K1ES31_CHOCO|nr:carboxypeptidase-like regulatory domain-containing protein [Chondromyces crocatus]AKT43735.1 uncharacterized protein CMC5_079700 [Chondromyces crocatus]